MKQFLTEEAIRKSEKRAKNGTRILVLCIALGAAAVAAIALATRTGNARAMTWTAIAAAAAAGWGILAFWMFRVKPDRAEARHLKGLAEETPRELTGRLAVRKDSFRIPKSVRVRKVGLETEGETLSLNVDEKLAGEMPADGSLVRVTAARKFITGVEVLEEGGGDREHAGEPAGKRALRAAGSFIPAAVLWLIAAVLLVGFVFVRITDTDPAHKITVYADCAVSNAAELAEKLEAGMEGAVRMVKVHPFSYALFGTSGLKAADLYIIPDSRIGEYSGWTAPEAGIPVYDPARGLAAAGDYFAYAPEGEKGEVYRLYYGKESVHREDGLAEKAAKLLCGMADADGGPAVLPDAGAAASDTLYVKKVENLPEDFIFGMDISSVLAEEASGVKYYGFDGKETDLFRILAASGINHIRVRIWNDPYDSEGNGFGGGNCDIRTAVEIGKRATACGMKLLADFHYSDFWADPGKQMVPRAWAGMDIDEKKQALYDYTLDCMKQLKEAGVDVGMVQLGNETNGALCGEKIWMNIAFLMDAGARAVREIYPEALIALHFANPENAESYRTYARKMDYYEKSGLIQYDVFATSYYPYWHGTLDNLAAILTEISETYGKKVMVMETSWAYTGEDTDFSGNTIGEGSAVTKDYPYTPQGQANSIRNITDTVVNRTPKGIGVCYWEGAWITVGTDSWEANHEKWEKYGSGWASSYAKVYDPNDAGKYYGGSAVDNQAFFDREGKPLESLKVFRLMRTGNEIAPVPDALEEPTVICDLNMPLELPATVDAIMTDDSRQSVAAAWDLTEEEDRKMHANGPARYTVAGKAGGMEAKCFVSMIEYNYMADYSFEENSPAWVITDLKRADELYIEDKKNDSLTGSKHLHFWSSGRDTVEFTAEQTVKDLPAGKFRFSISAMGGDCGETDIRAYVKIGGQEVARSEQIPITGYNDWHAGVIPEFTHEAGTEVTVGIYVKCEGAGNGAWGKIDDALLNSVQ